MMSLVNKSANLPPNYHKILIFSPPKSLKRLRAARIDELADSNEPVIMQTSARNKKNKYIIWYWLSNPLIKFVKTEIRKEYFVQHYLLCEIQPKWVKGM